MTLQLNLHLNGTMWWAVCALAVFRVTRLIIADEITEPIRRAIIKRAGRRLSRKAWKHLAYFLTCPWCVGFWVALGLLLLVTKAAPVAPYVVIPLSWSASAGLLAERLG